MKPNLLYITKNTFLAVFMAFWSFSVHAKIIYVRAEALGSADGSSWTDAFPKIQQGIDAASDGDEVWVAAGVYLPSRQFGGGQERHLSFGLTKNIRLKGSFSGLAGTEGKLEESDLNAHPTILSGDIGMEGSNEDNSFHVMTIGKVNSGCIIESLIIEGGKGDQGGGIDAIGQGVFVNASGGTSSPVFADCIIRNNENTESGAGLHVDVALGKFDGSFQRVHFLNNSAGGGGGISIVNGENGEIKPTFIDCSFKGNTAKTAQGGAVSIINHSGQSACNFINCVFTGNSSPFSHTIQYFSTGNNTTADAFINCTISGNQGNGIVLNDIGTSGENNAVIKLRNTIVWDNGPGGSGLSISGGKFDIKNSLVSGLFEEGNISLDPKYVEAPSKADAPHTDGDVRLLANSPAIDAGKNNEVPPTIITDAAGNPRFLRKGSQEIGVVDMGAFEFQPILSDIETMVEPVLFEVYPNPARQFITIKSKFNQNPVFIFDAFGRLISTTNTDGLSSIDVSSFYKGIYLIAIHYDQQWHTQKIVIE